MKRFAIGFLAGIGVASVIMPRLLRNLLTENRLLSDNANIERNKKLIASVTKTQLTNHDYRNRYPENT